MLQGTTEGNYTLQCLCQSSYLVPFSSCAWMWMNVPTIPGWDHFSFFLMTQSWRSPELIKHLMTLILNHELFCLWLSGLLMRKGGNTKAHIPKRERQWSERRGRRSISLPDCSDILYFLMKREATKKRKSFCLSSAKITEIWPRRRKWWVHLSNF